jgi:hypothetical protein
MFRAIMKKVPLTPISGSPNTYLLSYDYKIFPIDNTSDYEFKIRVPFDGLKVAQNGGRVQLTIVTPIGAQIDDSYFQCESTNCFIRLSNAETPFTA